MDFYAKLTAFLAVVEQQKNDYTLKNHTILQENALKEGRRGYHHIGYDEGNRFVRVWDESGGQKSVLLFVEKDTGIVFGAKSWKIYNPNHEFGTLETITEWNWSGYSPTSLTGKNSLVPKANRR